jgi:putative RecB family exonuclease
MPRRLFAVTPTRLTTWQDCPRRYRMSYVDRPTPSKGAPWAHNSVGAAAHNALRAWWDLAEPARTSQRAARLVDECWRPEGFRDDQQCEQWRMVTRDQVATYVNGVDPSDEPLGVERTVSFPSEVLAVSGRVDRIDRRVTDDERAQAVIVDYKTGRWVPSDTDARSSLALALYALGAQRTLRLPCTRVELHHLPSGVVAVAEHSAESLQRHLGRAEQVGAEARDAEAAVGDRSAADRMDDLFPPSPGPRCSWCDFRAHCPEGMSASTTRRSWDALDEAGARVGIVTTADAPTAQGDDW